MISTATDLFAEALFASDLQPSESPTVAAVQSAVVRTILRLGTEGCAGALAGEFGDHPESAARRMTWARQTVAAAYQHSAAPRRTGSSR